MKFFFILSFFLFVIISCEQETQINIPYSESRIAVSSILIPDKNIEIYIYKSTYILETKDQPVINATVKLYSDSKFIETIAHDTIGIYRSFNTIPKKGRTYSIEVSVDGFSKLSAKTTVPYAVLLDSIKVDRFIGTNDNGFPLSLLILYFTETSNELSFYQYNCKACTDSINSFGPICPGEWFSYNPIILEEGDKKSNLFTSNLFTQDNVLLELSYEDPVGFYFATDTVNYTITAQILSLSEELYNYQKSLNSYTNRMKNIQGINNPPKIFSNITNGYGIFAAVSYSNFLSQRITDYTK